MKKLIQISLIGMMAPLYASDYSKHIELTDEQKYEYFTSQGLPIPGSGVHVVPSSQMDKSATSNIQKNSLSLSKKGYIERKSIHAENLLNIKRLSAKDLQDNLGNTNPHSTHMRATPEEVHTAYEYHGVPSELVAQVIGFSAGGSYIEERGWTGAAEFFEPRDIEGATCLYAQSNLKLTGGAANLAREIVSYDVNNKVSVVSVIGNRDSAFEYDVEWFDDNFHHELHCAKKTYDKETIKKVIHIAKKIDK